MKTLPATTTKDEALSVASEMANAHRTMVEHYRKEYELSNTDAEARTSETLDGLREHVMNKPSDQVSWYDLDTLGISERSPDALAKWESVKESARAELRSGWRAAEATEWVGATPWQRARFLALRNAFAEEWQPRGGMEWALVDMLAQAYTGWEAYVKMTTGRAVYYCEDERKQYKINGRYKTLDRVATAEEALESAERFQRMYVRAMRMLQNLRRYAPAININQPRSVNIAAAGGQQVNVTEGEGNE